MESWTNPGMLCGYAPCVVKRVQTACKVVTIMLSRSTQTPFAVMHREYMLPALLNRKSKLSIRLGFTDLARTPAENPMTRIILPPPLVVELPERSPIGCGYCYKHDRIDDCAHRFPHCRTCRCSDCRPMEWKQRRCGEDVIAERVIRFDG